jgi:hypothetical protein
LTVDLDNGENLHAWSKPLAKFIMPFPRLKLLDLYFDMRLEQSCFRAVIEGFLFATPVNITAQGH